MDGFELLNKHQTRVAECRENRTKSGSCEVRCIVISMVYGNFVKTR